MTKMIEVIALENGHDGRVYRRAGERFMIDEKRLEDGSSWFAKPEDAPEPAPAAKEKRPPGAGPKPGSASGEDEVVGAGPK